MSDTSTVKHEGKTTTFQDDDAGVLEHLHHTPIVHRGPTYSTITNPSDIADFLARPIPVYSGSYSTSSSANTTLWDGDLSLAISTQPIWVDKLKGFKNRRGTIRVKLVINAMPFQAGVLMLQYTPIMPGLTRDAHTGNLTSSSQLPGIKVNVRQSFGEFDVPYRNPAMYADPTIASSGWGRIRVASYVPLLTGPTSETSCEFSIWLSLHDMELEVPAVPQSDGGGAKRRSNRIIRPSSKTHEANSGEGPVSMVLGGAGKVAKGLGHIPLLGPVMGSAQWLLNAAHGVASSFGWSKTIVTTAPSRMIQERHAYHVNSNGEDGSSPFGLLADAEISVSDDMGFTKQDEMSIAYIASQWCYVATFDWNSAQTSATSLYYVEASPHSWRNEPLSIVGGGKTTTTYVPTPMGYLCNMFRYYTGGVEIRLRFVKTDFHSGRLVVAFNPTTSTSLSYTNSQYALREIIDIREKDEVCFSLPYTSVYPWSKTGSDVLGHFAVFVQTPLSAAPVVSDGIKVIVEVRAAADFAVAVPQYSKILPFFTQSSITEEGRRVQTSSLLDTIRNVVFKAQSGISVEGQRVMECEPIGGSIAQEMTDESQYTIGECVLSIAQLCKRYTRVYLQASPGGTPLNYAGAMYPFSLGAYTHVPGSAPTNGSVLADYLCTFAPLYAFWRGGVRVKMVTNTNNVTTVALLASPSTIGTNDTGSWSQSDVFGGVVSDIPSTSGTGNHAPNVISPNAVMNGFSVSVPAYCPTRYRVVAPNVTQSTLSPTEVSRSDVSLNWSSVPTSDPSIAAVMYRAGGDDLQFGMFLGTIRVAYQTV